MEATGRDYYQILGVPRDAEGSAIKRAYLRLIRQNTPESAPDRFREVSEAYRILSNPEKPRGHPDHRRADGFPSRRALRVPR
jgi:curved DNA-binding protein CbpA